MNPIGIFRSSAVYKAQAPRQGVFEESRVGSVILAKGLHFEQALRDLDGFERIWLIYQFDRNQDWRPTTRPPVPPAHADRVGVFASRSPYRPNPIGLSCVKLVSIHGLELSVEEADLIDNTPILDIKPYVPTFDSFPEARAGWLENQIRDSYTLTASAHFAAQAEWVLKSANLDLFSFAQVQLSINPLDQSRKRVTGTAANAVLAHRTWRIRFSVDTQLKTIALHSILSGYTEKDLQDSADPYSDKAFHRLFNLQWA